SRGETAALVSGTLPAASKNRSDQEFRSASGRESLRAVDSAGCGSRGEAGQGRLRLQLLRRAAADRAGQAMNVGTKLGPYEILSAIGAGGMGEVYRARDTRLNRDVALKVLPEAFATDPDRLARFKREAQVLASLNHPTIAAIYGFEDGEGVHALVLELVEGP